MSKKKRKLNERTSTQKLPIPIEVAVNPRIAHVAEKVLRAYEFGNCRVLFGFDKS